VRIPYVVDLPYNFSQDKTVTSESCILCSPQVHRTPYGGVPRTVFCFDPYFLYSSACSAAAATISLQMPFPLYDSQDCPADLKKICFNCKKVGWLIRNKPCDSFGFKALRQQHEWV